MTFKHAKKSAFICIFILLLVQIQLVAVDPSVRPGMGATVYDGGTTFRVWAPNADTVNVAGSFNGWNGISHPLADEGNGIWSADINGAGLYHEYKYVINGNIWKTDPRARDVVSSVGNGIIENNEYNWIEYSPPAWNEMVIYEMHVGTFNDTNTSDNKPGTFLSAINKLDYLQALGVNAVELMPIGEFPGDYSMGYNPVNIYAPEGAYGSPYMTRRFIDECHQRGIAVLIDVVYNHLGPDDLGTSIWQFDGYSLNDDPQLGGIYFYEDDNRYTPWGNTRPNYVTGEVRSFIRDNALYWLTEYNADGLRWDGTAYIRERGINEPEIGEGWTLMQWVNNEIDAICPENISLAEDMRDNEWMTKTTGEGGAGFDSQWDASFHHKLVSALTTPNDIDRNIWDVKNAIEHKYNGWDTQRIIYTESHDEVGQSSGKKRLPEEIWDGNADSWFSKKRSTLGAGIVLTSPGIPMLFMGQEFLEDGSWHDNVPLDWDRFNNYIGIATMYRDLIHVRRNLSNNTRGLQGNHVNVFHVNDSAKVVAYHRWYNGGVGDDVVILANFGNVNYEEYNIGMPAKGLWRVRFNSDWNGYDSEFGNWDVYDTYAYDGVMHGLGYHASVRLGAYSMVILSQGTGPDLDGDGKIDLVDLSYLAAQWLNGCNDNDSCSGADYNMSGSVGMDDLYRISSSWLKQN